MVTASIVTYHTSGSELEQCFNSLASSGSVSKVYVVDNGQEERIRSLCAQASLPTEYIPLSNPGYGAGHNAAMRRAMDDGAVYHMVLNTDVVFGQDVIPALTQYLDSNPDVGMAQPYITRPDGALEPTARMLPTPADLILRRFLPKGWFKRSREKYLLAHIDHSQPFNAPYLEGSFMFMRMAAVKDIGGFDERFFMYPEDIDLTRRMHAHWRTMYCPIAHVVHNHQRASYHSLKMLRIHCVNMIKYFNKWGWWRDPERKRFNQPFL